MADAVSICNLALSFLGDTGTVASIDPAEKSAQARLCAIYYPVAKQAMLEMHDWSFAVTERKLDPLEEESTWKAVALLPSDCIHLIRVRDAKRRETHRPRPPRFYAFTSGPIPDGVLFMAQDGKIYAEAEEPVVTYVSSETPETRFPATFVTALAYYLAVELAGSRVKGKEGQALAQTLQKSFQSAFLLAKSRDVAQQQRRVDFVPKWLEVR